MSERVEAARDAFYQARWEQKKPLDPIRFGVEWADTNPQPTTITRAEFEDAYTYWFDGLPSRERAFEFLWALGVKVLDTDTEA